MLFALIHHDGDTAACVQSMLEAKAMPGFVVCTDSTLINKTHIARAVPVDDDHYDLFDAQGGVLGRAEQINFDYPDYAGQFSIPAADRRLSHLAGRRDVR
jgi:hypothetical protein